MVLEKIKAILSEQLDIDENNINADSLIVEDLGADSLDAIDIVMSVEDEFGIEVPDEIVEKMESVNDIITFVENNI
ncbi:MAG TPA: acyl carrier protein [Ruminococcaceae bacterium]|nr:acyl carrier protein [Oscillospiraceae bacterium]